jgi:hypothetical protein
MKKVRIRGKKTAGPKGKIGRTKGQDWQEGETRGFGSIFLGARIQVETKQAGPCTHAKRLDQTSC